MKSIITVVLSLICFVSIAQDPPPYKTPYQPLGSKNVMVETWAEKIDSTLIPPVYTDTFLANKGRTSLYAGSIIRVGDTYYYRNSDATGWLLFSQGCLGTRLINGSITWTGTGLLFDATDLLYDII